jgi:hypothetical protein
MEPSNKHRTFNRSRTRNERWVSYLYALSTSQWIKCSIYLGPEDACLEASDLIIQTIDTFMQAHNHKHQQRVAGHCGTWGLVYRCPKSTLKITWGLPLLGQVPNYTHRQLVVMQHSVYSIMLINTVINGSFEHSIWTAAHIANMWVANILKRQKVMLVSTSYREKRSKRFVHFYMV